MLETRTSISSARQLTTASFVAFAAFGSFWGAWGASVPRVQDQAGVTDGQLGLALLFVGAGALPAMLLAGRAVDRWGLRVAALAISALGAVGAGLALTAVSLPSLSVGLALTGGASGAADVAMNAVAGRAETVAKQPVITRAHGVFSAAVVLASLATGLAAAAFLPLPVTFVAVAVLCLTGGVRLFKALPPGPAPRRHDPPTAATSRTAGRAPTVPLVLVGVLGALAFASENAHQSWSAVFADAELHSGPGLAAVAPAVFAGTVAITRLSVGRFEARRPRRVLQAGALAAATGAAIIGVAPTLPLATLGLTVAAAGTAVLFPTILGIVSRNLDESRRGHATSAVTAISYLGFLLGPVYVGLCADIVGLRGAMLAVAALGVLLFLLAAPLLHRSRLDGPTHGADVVRGD